MFGIKKLKNDIEKLKKDNKKLYDILEHYIPVEITYRSESSINEICAHLCCDKRTYIYQDGIRYILQDLFLYKPTFRKIDNNGCIYCKDYNPYCDVTYEYFIYLSQFYPEKSEWKQTDQMKGK